MPRRGSGRAGRSRSRRPRRGAPGARGTHPRRRGTGRAGRSRRDGEPRRASRPSCTERRNASQVDGERGRGLGRQADRPSREAAVPPHLGGRATTRVEEVAGRRGGGLRVRHRASRRRCSRKVGSHSSSASRNARSSLGPRRFPGCAPPPDPRWPGARGGGVGPECVDQRSAAVRRAVVDHDDLEVLQGLRGDRLERPPHVGGLVEQRHDDRHSRARLGGSLGWSVARQRARPPDSRQGAGVQRTPAPWYSLVLVRASCARCRTCEARHRRPATPHPRARTRRGPPP